MKNVFLIKTIDNTVESVPDSTGTGIDDPVLHFLTE